MALKRSLCARQLNKSSARTCARVCVQMPLKRRRRRQSMSDRLAVAAAAAVGQGASDFRAKNLNQMSEEKFFFVAIIFCPPTVATFLAAAVFFFSSSWSFCERPPHSMAAASLRSRAANKLDLLCGANEAKEAARARKILASTRFGSFGRNYASARAPDGRRWRSVLAACARAGARARGRVSRHRVSDRGVA